MSITYNITEDKIEQFSDNMDKLEKLLNKSEYLITTIKNYEIKLNKNINDNTFKKISDNNEKLHLLLDKTESFINTTINTKIDLLSDNVSNNLSGILDDQYEFILNNIKNIIPIKLFIISVFIIILGVIFGPILSLVNMIINYNSSKWKNKIHTLYFIGLIFAIISWYFYKIYYAFILSF